MFKFFKKLWGGNAVADDEASDANIQVLIKPTLPNPAKSRATAPAHRSAQVDPPVRSVTPAPRAPAAPSGQQVMISLQSIVLGLPMELKSRVRPGDFSAEIPVPLEKVLSQLASGSIKISFGEIRKAAPSSFTGQTDRDQVLVSLPLGEVLAQLNPALLLRRQAQRHIEVPEEIRSPFGDTGQGLIFSVGPGENAAAAPARAVAPASPAPAAPPAPPALRKSTPASAPVRPVGLAPSASASPAPVPVQPARSSITAVPTPPAPAAPAAAPLEPAVIRMPTAATPAVEIKPAAVPSAQAGPVTDGPAVNLPLGLVSEAWPESVRTEISQWNLGGAALAVPLETLKESLQRGKAFFPWKTLRGWLKPAAPESASAHDNTSLELPLKVVAPIFIARQRDLAQAKQKVAIDETIPNLFFGFPQPESAPAASATPAPASCAVTKPVDTNYYSVNEGAEPAAVTDTELRRTGPTGTAFIAKCATPNEIVSRAAALGGVAGALIALPDGLMVASKLSSDLNGDTLAAFLPQIFSKVNQCTNELRMGELNNLNFTVGSVPWKIFRVNAIFFAAFGRAGQPLPTAALAALAGELDHKKQ